MNHGHAASDRRGNGRVVRRGADFSRPSRSLLHRDLPLPKISRSASRRGWILPALLAGLLVALLCPLNLSAAHKLRVTDPAAAAAIQARGGRLIADYGGFQLLEIDDAKEIARHPGAIRRDGENVIELHARRIDTSAPETRLLRGQARNFAGKRLHLVQFAGPVRPGGTRRCARAAWRSSPTSRTTPTSSMATRPHSANCKTSRRRRRRCSGKASSRTATRFIRARWPRPEIASPSNCTPTPRRTRRRCSSSTTGNARRCCGSNACGIF